MKITVNNKRVPDVVIVPIVQDDNFDETIGQIASRSSAEPEMLKNDFKAESGESFLVYAQGNPGRKLYLLGLGAKANPTKAFKAIQKFIFNHKSKLPEHIGFDLRGFPSENLATIAEYIAEGAIQGLYSVPTPGKKSKKIADHFGSAKSEFEFLVDAKKKSAIKAAAQRGKHIAEARLEVRNIINLPSNFKTPMMLAKIAQKAGKACGFSVKIMNDADLTKEGLTAIQCIGMGSDNPPVMILLEYKPDNVTKKASKLVGLVGKGITFDTGGISIKPSNNMGYMKSDLGGGAAVIGTFMAAARLKLQVRMVGAIPAAENMPSSKAVKPGDVTQTYSGKTIEIIDTDAEGRVVLADGLAYIVKNKKPDVLIDLATLTGAVVRSLGYEAAGLFTQNDELAAKLTAAGNNSGDLVWRMPMFDVYNDGIKSDVADVKNYSPQPPGGASWAAKFLEVFTDEHPCWAHLDIAGTAFGSTIYGKSKAGTGYGVRLLVDFMEKL